MLNIAVAHQNNSSNRLSRLRNIIAEKSMRRGEFKLASGRGSDIFFDMKPTMLDPEASNIIADEILDLLEGENVDFIGGLEMGAVPMVQMVCVKSLGRKPIPAFFVRKAVKDHGTRERIEGNLEDGSNVVLVDDVTTTGGSVLQAVEVVRGRGCKVSKVLTIVDRREGAGENLAAQGIELVPLLTRDDFSEI